MRSLLITKLLAVLIIASLVFGQGALNSVMAMPMSPQQKSTDSPSSNAAASMSMSHCMEKHPSAKHDKAKPSKGISCEAACAAFSQVMMPFVLVASDHYAVRVPYEYTDTTSVSRVLLPDYPPPKA